MSGETLCYCHDSSTHIPKEITYQKVEEGEVGCCSAGYFGFLLFKHLQRLYGILEILLS